MEDGSSNHLEDKISTNNNSATYVNSQQLPIEIKNIGTKMDQLQHRSLSCVLLLRGSLVDGLLSETPPSGADVAGVRELGSHRAPQLVELKECVLKLLSPTLSNLNAEHLSAISIHGRNVST